MACGRCFLVDLEDLPSVLTRRWHAYRCRRGSYELIYVRSQNKKNISPVYLSLHRFLTDCPDGLVIDHLNHNPLDNRRCNIKICTQAENNKNRRAPNSCGNPVKSGEHRATHRRVNGSARFAHNGAGVSFKRNRWEAQVRYRGAYHYLGRFHTKEEAISASDQFRASHSI